MTALAFVVGTGRCGSTLLSDLLAHSPQIASLSEFFSAIGPERAFTNAAIAGPDMWHLLGQRRRDVEELLALVPVPEIVHVTGSGFHKGATEPLMLVALPGISDRPEQLHDALGAELQHAPTRALGAQYRHVFEWLRIKAGKRMLVERSGGSLAYAAELIRLFPRARFIHLFRDGPECAYSMSKHPYFQVLATRLERRDTALPVGECLTARISMDRYATLWSAMTIRGLAALRRLSGEQVLHVAFEDLTSQPASVLGRITRFLGVDAEHSWIPRTCERVRVTPTHLTELEPDVQASLRRGCRPGLRALDALGLSLSARRSAP